MKKNIFFSALAIVAVAGVFIFSAFTPTKSKSVAVQYVFNGNSSLDSKNAANYSMIDENDPEPGCDGSALPCIVEVEGNLQTWLDARTELQILSEATATKD